MLSLLGARPRAPKLLAAFVGLALVAPAPAVLLAPAAVADSSVIVEVTVTDANDEPLADVSVTTSSGIPASEPTDEEGLASIELVNGTYQLQFEKPGFVTAKLPSDDGEGAASVQIGPGTDEVRVDGELVEDNALTMTLDSNVDRVLSGQVLGAGGAPLAGISVKAVDQDDRTYTSAPSNASGAFSLPVRIGTYTLTYLGAVIGNHTYVNTPYGGAPVEVTQTVTPALATRTMSIDDGSTTFDLAGTVSDGNGDALAGVTVSVLPAGSPSAAAVATDTTAADGSYAAHVRPGTYWLRFEKAGYASAYLENGEDEGPVTVTVSATGAVSAPQVELDSDGLLPDVSLLLPAPAMTEAPKLTGKAVVGGTLTLSPGKWQGLTIDTDYVTVDWFIGDEPADDYSAGSWWQKFDVPLEAVGAEVGFRITIEDPDGARESAVYEGSSSIVPKAVSSLKATVKKGVLTAIVSVPGVPKPTGTVVVKDGKKKVATAKLTAKSKGKAVVKLKLKPGKHKLTLTYAGPSSITPAKKIVKVTVRK